jgi:hypothetical protein
MIFGHGRFINWLLVSEQIIGIIMVNRMDWLDLLMIFHQEWSVMQL